MTAAVMLQAPVSAAHGGSFETSPFRRSGEVSLAVPGRPKQGKPRLSASGISRAVSNSNSGVPALSPQSSGRGGPRNSAKRESFGLTTGQVRSLLAASRHAQTIGLPFTRMVTIHWQAAGVSLESLARATGRFVDMLTKALRRHGSSTAWLWVHENCGPKGGHCHLLVHVPAALVLIVSKLQMGWLRRITGKAYRKRVIHSEPIGGRLGLEIGNRELHQENLAAALSYVLKGADQQAAAAFDLERLQGGGRIIGKRCGTSQNIASKARLTGDVR